MNWKAIEELNIVMKDKFHLGLRRIDQEIEIRDQ